MPSSIAISEAAAIAGMPGWQTASTAGRSPVRSARKAQSSIT
jgi:hypothetical protein